MKDIYTRKEVIELIQNIREGNTMLDNEPILFVKGFEAAIKQLLAKLNVSLQNNR